MPYYYTLMLGKTDQLFPSNLLTVTDMVQIAKNQMIGHFEKKNNKSTIQ